MIDLTIGSVALVPLIITIIELAKRLGLSSTAAPYVNIGLTVVAVTAVMFLRHTPEAVTGAVIVVQAIATILAVAGGYDLIVQPAVRTWKREMR